MTRLFGFVECDIEVPDHIRDHFLGISAENVKGLIKPEIREESEQNEHLLFVTPLTSQSKHTPGLLKVEFKGEKMIRLCSKSYCTAHFHTVKHISPLKIHPSKSSLV